MWVFLSTFLDQNSRQDKHYKLLMLTKASTIEIMWATLSSNQPEFPTHTNSTKQCSFLRKFIVIYNELNVIYINY